jgi:hypothetical protein
MNQRETNLLDALREANPVDVERLRGEVGDDGLADARHQVARIVGQRPVPRARPRRSRRLRLVGAAAVGVAALAAVLAALPSGHDPVGGRGPLGAAAALAADLPSTLPARGEYSYLKLGVGSTEDAGGSVTEWWIGTDRSGRMLKSLTGLGDGETPVGEGWRQTAPGSWLNDNRFGPGQFARLYPSVAPAVVHFDVEQLPSEPGALLDTLRRSLRIATSDRDPETGFAPGSIAMEAQLLTLIGQVLAHPLASPPLRSALYTVAGRLGGVTVRERVQDPIGRRGTALSFTERIGRTTNRHEVIFDPATSETLATQLVSTEPTSVRPLPPKQAKSLQRLTETPSERALPQERGGAPSRTRARKAQELPARCKARTCRSITGPKGTAPSSSRSKRVFADPQNRGARTVMQRFTQYVVYLARGVVDSSEERP